MKRMSKKRIQFMQDANMRSIRRRNRVAYVLRVQRRKIPNNFVCSEFIPTM